MRMEGGLVSREGGKVKAVEQRVVQKERGREEMRRASELRVESSRRAQKTDSRELGFEGETWR